MPTRSRKRSPRPDPTRLSGVRRRYTAEVKRRYAAFRAELVRLVWTEDAFGLSAPEPYAPVTNKGLWRGATVAEKASRFGEWVRAGIDRFRLGRWFSGALTSLVDYAYGRGANDGYDDASRAKPVPGSTPASRQVLKDGVLRATATDPATVEAKAAVTGRIVADAVKQGTDLEHVLVRAATEARGTPKETAMAMAAEVEKAAARTEQTVEYAATRAHADGTLTLLRRLGVKDVGTVPEALEWQTSGVRVCPRCRAMSGKRFRIADAVGLIPLHPFCRCRWKTIYRKTAVSPRPVPPVPKPPTTTNAEPTATAPTPSNSITTCGCGKCDGDLDPASFLRETEAWLMHFSQGAP